MNTILAHLGLSFAAIVAAAPASPPAVHKVLELRQYKLAEGMQDKFVALFDAKFVESQEDDGMRIIGQFTDHDRPDRFTWIREFPGMEARAKSLQAFYFGPVWSANKAVANPMLFDNDNVLLLKAVSPESSFGPSAKRAARGSRNRAGMIFVTIEYLWQTPDHGFSSFFLDHMQPRLNEAGLKVLGAYVPEEAPNNFPRLPVRCEKKLLVWFTRADGAGDFARITRKLHSSSAWKREIAPKLAEFEERPPQVLRLDPTPRSALR